MATSEQNNANKCQTLFAHAPGMQRLIRKKTGIYMATDQFSNNARKSNRNVPRFISHWSPLQALHRDDPNFESRRCTKDKSRVRSSKKYEEDKHHRFATLDQHCSPSRLAFGFLHSGREILFSWSGQRFPQIRGMVLGAQP